MEIVGGGFDMQGTLCFPYLVFRDATQRPLHSLLGPASTLRDESRRLRILDDVAKVRGGGDGRPFVVHVVASDGCLCGACCGIFVATGLCGIIVVFWCVFLV